jgi:hypothetical protein
MNRETAIAVWTDINSFALESNGALWGPCIEHAETCEGSDDHWTLEVCFSGPSIRSDLAELCVKLARKHGVDVAFGQSVEFS